MKNKNYNIKALKNETDCTFVASLYQGKKKVATIISKGQVVNCVFNWKDEKSRLAFEKFISELPERILEEYDPPLKFPEDANSFIADLASKHAHQVWLKSLTKTHTVYKLKSDAVPDYNILDMPYDEEVKQKIIDENGDNLLEIFNELI